MAKSAQKKPKRKRRDLKAAEQVEVEPDAWERFERGVHALVKKPAKQQQKTYKD